MATDPTGLPGQVTAIQQDDPSLRPAQLLADYAAGPGLLWAGVVGPVVPPALDSLAGGTALSSPSLARRAVHVTNPNNATKAMQATCLYSSRKALSSSLYPRRRRTGVYNRLR